MAVQIWVDADACPSEIKELLFRAAVRTQIKVTLVANRSLFTPRSEFIDSILVPDGINLADRRIVELVSPGDLVITADIPLAADVVAQGGQAPTGACSSPFNNCHHTVLHNSMMAVKVFLSGWRQL